MAKVYVGTYGKYNEGSIAGGWLDLADYPKYNDFLNACKALHEDEQDPEFMIQDTEDFPDGLDCMEWIGESDFNDIRLAMKEESQEAEGRPSINIIDYSDKAFAVVGDTKAVKDELKKMGGRFNAKLSCGCGWIFSNKMRDEVEKFISSGEVTEIVRTERKTPEDGRQFVEWLSEFLDTCNKFYHDYYKKHAVGAVKMHDSYYIIEKPSIDNRFCFHDEGPQYEQYKELRSHEDKMARYFKAENLREFDIKIERMTKGEGFDNDKRVWWHKDENTRQLYLTFHSGWGRDNNDGETLCTDEERRLILKGLQFGRSQLEKRLDAYLKRYGVSKLHTWTYWADA